MSSEAALREKVAARRETLGDKHPKTLGSINNMALLLQTQGKLAEAEPLYREALAGRREMLGNKHTGTLDSVNNMAVVLKEKGNVV